MKKIVLSGIRPTGQLHLGNYLGALSKFVKMQQEGVYDSYFFIADLHALTTHPDASQLAHERTFDYKVDTHGRITTVKVSQDGVLQMTITRTYQR